MRARARPSAFARVALLIQLTIYKTTYISVITHGCETNVLPFKHKGKLHDSEMRYLSKTERKTTRDKISDQTVRMGLPINDRNCKIEKIWFTVRMGVRDTPKWPGKLETGE